MKKLISIVTLSLSLIAIPSVSAQDLIYVGSGNDGSNYSVDKQWMKYYSDTKLVGFIYTNRLREPNIEGVLFSNYAVIGNCSNKNLLFIGVNSYNEKNRMISSKKFDYHQVPDYGSPNYKAVVKVCTLLGVY